MDFDVAFKWLYDSALAMTIRENELLFPWIESLHVLSITLVVGSIAIVDLRLLGLASLDRAVTRVTRDVLPCTWIAFAFAALTGAALFTSNAVNYAHNFYFQGKILLLALAGLNMLAFHLAIGKQIANWEALAIPPFRAKIVAAASLILWVIIIGFGRWIGFTIQPTLTG